MFNSLICSLLSDSVSKITTAIIILLIVGTIIYFLIKSAEFRVFFGYFFCFLVIVCGIFSGFCINKYYNTKGGIVGQLSGFFNPNLVESEISDKDITFNFSNVMLTKYSDDRYRAEFLTEDSITLAVNEGYVVYVNDTPCELIEYGEDYTSEEISSDYVIAEYYYAFYDEYKEYILKDKLSFRLAFYKNSTRLIVETTGGEDAVSLWNSYFQKNNFIVRISAYENVYISSYATINLKVDDSVVNSVKVKKGSVFVLPTFDFNGYRFNGWSLDGENILNIDSLLVTEDIDIFAHLDKLYRLDFLKFNYDSSVLDYNSTLFYSVNCAIGDKMSDFAPVNNPLKDGFEFVGWSLDGVNVIDLENTYFNESMNKLIAVYNSIPFDYNFNLNYSVISIGSKISSHNFTYSSNTSEKLVVLSCAKSSCIFEAYRIEHPTNSNLYFYIYDENFNMSFTDIRNMFIGNPDIFGFVSDDDLNFSSVNVYVCFTPSIEYKSNWKASDYSLALMKIYGELDLCIYEPVYTSLDVKKVIAIPFESITLSDSSSMSISDIMSYTIEIFDIDVEINESMIAIDYLEILYDYFSERSEIF